MKRLLCIFIINLVAATGLAQQDFSSLTGPLTTGPVSITAPYEMPFITWGGDVATFYANGTSLTTQPGSIYEKLGINIKLVNGDDFVGQAKKYVTGKTPFVRGTFRMLGQASEVLGKDATIKPVVILQETWSAGDHIVAREGIKKLNDLKGKTIACQQGGPHVGLVDDMLSSAQLTWKDIVVVWVKDLAGPGGPAELFKKDIKVDACCVISPDMIGLTGGLDQVGSGAEGSVKGAHVLVSTAEASRSIADVVAVRSDWYAKNQLWAEKFVAGYLAASEKVKEMRNSYEETGKMSAEYKKLLTMAQATFGVEVLPTIEVDAHGLLLDCRYVRLPGNIEFFQNKGNANGFDAKLEASLNLAVTQGYAKTRCGFTPCNFDYRKIATTAGITYEAPATTGGGAFQAESLDLFPDSDLEDRTIVTFTVQFPPNETTFSPDRYSTEINAVIKNASTFGNAAVAVVGHSDPTKTLVDLIKAGTAKGVLKRTGSKAAGYQYVLNGKALDLKQTDAVIKLIDAGAFRGADVDPQQTMQAAMNLSLARATAVKDGIIEYAKKQGKTINITQVQPVGMGIREPVIPKPTQRSEAEQNMRVEFKVVRVPGEAIDDFDY